MLRLLPIALVLVAACAGSAHRNRGVVMMMSREGETSATAREIPQAEARRLLLVDIHRPPFALQVPPELAAQQPQPHAGRYKVFVTSRGRVFGVEMAGKTGRDSVDAAFVRTIFTWRYRPYTVAERPVHFWHWLDVDAQ
jgi:hypothetical protein